MADCIARAHTTCALCRELADCAVFTVEGGDAALCGPCCLDGAGVALGMAVELLPPAELA